VFPVPGLPVPAVLPVPADEPAMPAFEPPVLPVPEVLPVPVLLPVPLVLPVPLLLPVPLVLPVPVLPADPVEPASVSPTWPGPQPIAMPTANAHTPDILKKRCGSRGMKHSFEKRREQKDRKLTPRPNGRGGRRW
jgi:hypothetical protein